MNTNIFWRFATILLLSFAFFLTNVSCSRNENRSEESCPQKDTLLPQKVENLPDTVEKELYDDDTGEVDLSDANTAYVRLYSK